ncbi:MAG: hypothetical protein E6G97_20855 [Alphaproteobacteria bacterium]|nr:MAG: hypothetical protein E6G97_20855 [Alphaproteobacteria bacterium]
MWQNYLIAAFVGWCGTGWPIRFPRVGGGGGVEPGDWPPNCPMCGGIVAAISAVILVAILGPAAESAGLIGLATISFFAGSFGSNFVGGIRGMASGR